MLIPPVGPTDRTQANQFRLSDGQFFKGKILGMADSSEEVVIEIGGRRLNASVQLPVEVGKTYLFQYLLRKDHVVLKMIQPFTNSKTQISGQTINELAQKFGLPQNSQTVNLLNFFLQNDLPFRGPLLKSVLQMIENVRSTLSQQIDFEVIEMMLRRNIPLKSSFYRFLAGTKGNHTEASSLNQLVALLEQEENPTQSLAELKAFIKSWPMLEDNQSSSTWLLDVLNRVGYFHEARLTNPDLLQGTEDMTLKAALLSILSDQRKGETSDHVQKLLAAITGQQLQSVPVDRSLIQWMFTLPLLFNNEFKDIQMHWEGKKNEQGKNESEYYKILFYFDFKILGETVIRILTQRKMLTVTLFNDKVDLENVMEKYKPHLQEKLSDLHYTLVSLNQVQGEVENAKLFLKSRETSLDVKI